MLVINDAGLKYGCAVGRVPPRPLTMTCIAKATLTLKPGATAELLPEDDQDNLDGDQSWNEDPKEGLRYASDFALFKPGADVLLAGTCYVPGGKSAPQSSVSFAVGGWSKTLAVFGDRVVRPGFLGSSVGEPIPFAKMPLTWSRAMGGPKVKGNPLGRGVDDSVLPDGTRVRLAPNVVLLSRADEPASFGPIDPSWAARMSKVGTYNAAWLRKNWPWFPDDFDWTFFQAAPDDQQLANQYLKGDERLAFTNLHPKLPAFECRLPGFRIRWFLQLRRGTALEFREVPMVLDTLFAEPDRERAVLVWRGVTGVDTYKTKEVEEIYLLREPLGTPLARSIDDYRTHCLRRKEEVLAAQEVEPVLLEPRAFVDPAIPDLGWVAQFDKDMAALQKPGFDPSRDPGWLKSPAAKLPTAAPPSPPPPPASIQESVAAMQRDWEIMRKAEPGYAKGIGDPMNYSGLIAAEQELAAAFPARAASPAPEAPADIPWTRERVAAHAAADGHFDGQDLTGLDLSGLDLRKRRFKNAVLQGASLARTRLDECDFSDANLVGAIVAGASFVKCTFREADLTEAAGEAADFTEASLDRADFSDGKLPKSLFCKARGTMTAFATADLSGAVFEEAELAQADFTGATLAGVRCARAKLTDAGLYEVSAAGADFTDAHLLRARGSQGNFTGSKFLRAKARESLWDESVLKQCDFVGAELPSSNFNDADLTLADLSAADLTASKLEDCVAEGARFIQSNLFRATFEGANLTGAVLLGANLFEVEFFGTTLAGADFSGANIKRTKLA